MPSYCTSSDLDLPADALAELASGDITSAISRASAEADSYLSTRFTLPLIQPGGGWPADLVGAVAAIATYRCMRKRGYAPDSGQNDTIRQGYLDAKKWLLDVSRGDATPQVKDSDTSAEAQEGGGPSSSAFVVQPDASPGGVFSLEEDFWHDRDSCAASPRGSRKRGY